MTIKEPYRVLLQCMSDTAVCFVMPVQVSAESEEAAVKGSVQFVLTHGGQITLYPGREALPVRVICAIPISVEKQPGLVQAASMPTRIV